MRTVGSTGQFSRAVNLQLRCWQQHSVIMGSGEGTGGLCCSGQGRMGFTGSNYNAVVLQEFQGQLRTDKLLGISGGKASEGWSSIPVGITCWQSAGQEPALLRPHPEAVCCAAQLRLKVLSRILAMQRAPALRN